MNPTPQTPEPWAADPFAIIMDAPSNPPNVEQACAAAKRAMVETCERARANGRKPNSSAVLAAALERLMAEGVTLLGDCVDHLNQLAADRRLLVGEAEPPTADPAQRPQQEQMAEALKRLRRWGGRHGWDGQVVQNVHDWIDAGMTGPLPPLPEYIARRHGEQSNV